MDWLPRFGELKPVTVMTLALLLACAVTRRWRGAVLTALAVPVAIGLTEYVLKPTVGQAIGAAFPSGHATSSFALAASFAVLLANPPRRVPGGVRLLLVLVAFLLAAAVAAAMVAIGAHTVSDAVGGAAVGVGVVLACALTLDALGSLLRPEPAAPPLPAARPAAERPAGSQVQLRPPTRS
jgi:membrane-associated phospholipid phosphatase